jgi:molybdenum cofactor guanylyltransferase
MDTPKTSAPPLAAIISGGRSRRFGSPKPVAELGGAALVDWVRSAVARVIPDPVLIANDPAWAAELDLPVRPDVVVGAGPLGGVEAALGWAEELGRPGALCVACDTPFLPPDLLQTLVDRFANSAAGLVAVESRGPLGIEPLCAVYGLRCLPEIRDRLRRGEHALGRLIRALEVETVPLAEVERHGDPEILFLNVNTPADFERAVLLSRGICRA